MTAGAFASLSEGGGIRRLTQAAGVSRKPDDGRSTPSVIAAGGADSSLWEGAVISLPPARDVEGAVPYGQARTL